MASCPEAPGFCVVPNLLAPLALELQEAFFPHPFPLHDAMLNWIYQKKVSFSKQRQ